MSDRDPLSARIAAAGLDWIVPDWPVPSHVRALSTTRNGGVSAGPYATLDLGFATERRATGSAPAAIEENRVRVARFLPSMPVWLDQRHGSEIARIDSGGTVSPRATPPVADGAVTRARDVVLAVLAADCLPVLLAQREGRVIGIAHAGWRGLAGDVIENTVAAMATAAADIVAWLGPAIGPDAFEVGDDVRDRFVDGDAAAAASFLPLRAGKWRGDLYALARRRLERAGVGAIFGGGGCTYSDPARFFSHRRDRETGRMASLLWISEAR